jgi:hypothetical protein
MNSSTRCKGRAFVTVEQVTWWFLQANSQYVALSEIARRLQSECALKPMLKNNTSPNSEVLLLFFFSFFVLLFLCKRTNREKNKNK